MYGKTGEANVNWKGGCTPERQVFYASQEWKSARAIVWERDEGQCRRCGKGDGKRHVHHIISFAVREHRTSADNLVVLCVGCHRWVHSRRNTKNEFIIRRGGHKYGEQSSP